MRWYLARPILKSSRARVQCSAGCFAREWRKEGGCCAWRECEWREREGEKSLGGQDGGLAGVVPSVQSQNSSFTAEAGSFWEPSLHENSATPSYRLEGKKSQGQNNRVAMEDSSSSFLSRPTRRHSQDSNILVLKGREHPSDAIEAAGKATGVRGSGGGDTPLQSWALGSRLRAIVCKAASGDSREVRGGDAVCLGNSSRHAACCHGQ